MTTHIVAAAQLGPASPTHAETVSRIVTLMHAAAEAGAELVVFPELALSPYFATTIRDDVAGFFETEMPSPQTAVIFDVAASRRLATVLPFAERDGATFYNGAVFIDETGVEVGRFRKVHIPGRVEPAEDGSSTSFEKRYFTPGNLGFPLYPSPVGELGMLICYDRRFPESYRCLGLAGAEVIAIGYNTGLAKKPDGTKSQELGQELSELAMRSGAYANGLYVIAAGKGGVEEGTPYIGGSLIIGPTGEVLAKAKTDADELVVAEIDRAAAAKIRERQNLALNRHPEKYGILTRTPVLA